MRKILMSSQLIVCAIGLTVLTSHFSNHCEADEIELSQEQLAKNQECRKRVQQEYDRCINEAETAPCNDEQMGTGCGYNVPIDDAVTLCHACTRYDSYLKARVYDFTLPSCDQIGREACLALAGLQRACELNQSMQKKLCYSKWWKDSEACGPILAPSASDF